MCSISTGRFFPSPHKPGNPAFKALDHFHVYAAEPAFVLVQSNTGCYFPQRKSDSVLDCFWFLVFGCFF